ncbi:MAG: hypothetical protein IJT91_02415 [Clostridia bacterium]|nr:hypothetical protein [Clostridia bacterium]
MKKDNKAKYVSISALLAALGVVIMYLGSLVEVLDLSLAALASIIITFAALELGRVYPILIYAVTSALSLLILPNKFGALVYLVFAGYYPIVKEKLEGRFGPKASFIPKFIIFNAALTVLVLAWIFVISQPEEFFYMYIVAYLIGNAAFLLYDIALTRMITLYVFKLRKRFGIDRFFK